MSHPNAVSLPAHVLRLVTRRPAVLRRLRLTRGPLAALAIAAVAAVALAACSGIGPAGTPESFDPNAPQITAQAEKFDTEELDVPGNQGFELVLFNKDSEPHNVSIYSDEGRSQRVYGGGLASQGTKVYHVQALAPGTYYFQCDVHPGMKGIIVAAAG